MSGTELDDQTFRAVVDNAVDGVVVGTPDGTILSANAAACRIFGAPEEHLCEVGRPGISNPDDPVWSELLAQRARTGKMTGVAPMFRLDGSPLMAEVSSTIIEGPNGEPRSCTILRDVTERVRMERRLVAYDEITEALLANVETTEVLTKLARHACAIFDATYAAVIVPADADEGIRVMAVFGPDSEHTVGRTYGPGGLSEVVMRTAEPILVEDISAVTRSDELRKLGLGPAMLAPLGSGDAIFGVLFIGGRPSRCPYQPDDLAEAARYAARAGVIMAMGKARTDAEAALRRTSEQLKQALDSRVVIEQAKGFLASVRLVSTDEAFALLRRYARSHSASIHSVARQVLERKLVV